MPEYRTFSRIFIARTAQYNRSMRSLHMWRLRSRSLELGRKTIIIGVLNVTPDSFSDGGEFLNASRAAEHALAMLEDGADILDIGGESTRPGARVQSGGTASQSAEKPVVTANEELHRVMPVIEKILSARGNALLSIDTYKSEVAQAAVAAGVEIVNDVSAFQWDERMASACAELQCGVVLMHTRGRPEEWRKLKAATDITRLVREELAERAQVALNAGIEPDRIVLDPGFGFGKNFDENYPLLAGFGELQRLGFPLLAGTSRKSFLAKTIAIRTGTRPAAQERLYGSLAAMVASILGGAHIVRVHDVKPAVEAASIADAILAAGKN